MKHWIKNDLFASISIQAKTWLIMCLIFPLFLILNILLLRNVLLSKFTELEEFQIRQNTGRAAQAVVQELKHLYTANSDWASWDNSYDFIQTGNPDFIESNLIEDTLASLDLNILYFIDNQGRIVWGQSIDLETERDITIEEFSAGGFTRENPLTGSKVPRLGTKGIYQTSAGPALVSTAPVLDSNGKGPRKGWIIMGRLLTEDVIERLGRQTQLTLLISPDVPFKPSTAQLKRMKKVDDMTFYEVVDQNNIHGYYFIEGLGGSEGAVMRIDMSREVHQKGIITIRFMAVLISITMILVFLLLSVLLRRFIISPITDLTGHILQLEKTRDLKLRVPQKEITSKDEACILANQVNRLLDTIEDMTEKLRNDARIDPLTMIANRRCYEEHLAREWQRLMRSKGRLAIIMCDIDHFKLYNDHYGHQQGDDCLASVAGLIRAIPQRPYDLVARYGGEEFVLVLPEASLSDASLLAEKIREKILNAKIAHETSPTAPWVTLSLGLASMVVTMGSHPEDLLLKADRALYRAKELGRNQVASSELSGTDA